VRGLSRIAGLHDVNVFVTDSGLNQDARTLIGEHAEKLVIAPARDGARRRYGDGPTA
jgi:DeoR/GlpR family transcriptional regulator of sugar metabolism